MTAQLLSSERKPDGLTSLAGALQQTAQTSGQNFLCLDQNRSHLQSVFQGLRSCLQVDETEEDILMKTNQILYDMMPEILKYADLQAEMQQLIPCLIENLGNSKVTRLPPNDFY